MHAKGCHLLGIAIEGDANRGNMRKFLSSPRCDEDQVVGGESQDKAKEKTSNIAVPHGENITHLVSSLRCLARSPDGDAYGAREACLGEVELIG